MGLPPSQGHNNLRLYHTTNYPHHHHHHHNNHNHRLNTNKHFYTKHQQQKHFELAYHQHQSRLNQYYYSHSHIDDRQPSPTSSSIDTILHSFDRLYETSIYKCASYPPPSSSSAGLNYDKPNMMMVTRPVTFNPFKLSPGNIANNNNRLHKSQPSFYSGISSCKHSDISRNDDNDDVMLNKIRPQYFHNSLPMVSNLPLINMDASMLLVNHSPFALQDPRFGILHHCSQSVSYF